MAFKKFAPVFHLLWISASAFALHHLYFYIPGNGKDQNFHYSLLEMYGFFSSFSLAILLILIVIKQKSIDNVGNGFLLLTCIKMAAAYVFILPVLQSEAKIAETETMHFFMIFAIFLATETILTIRILNKP